MRKNITFLIGIMTALLLGNVVQAQPDIEVTAVYVYETPYVAPGTEVSGDSVAPSEVVAVGLTLMNNGVDLLVGDTIRMGWSVVPNGSLISVLSNDLTSGNSGNFIVIQAQSVPTTLGPWEICIWPTYTSKGYTNADPMVGNTCRTYTIADQPTGISELALSVNRVYFNGGQLNLDLNSIEPQSMEVNIFTVSGQKVYQSTIRKGINDETVTLQTGDLKEGIYILRLIGQDGTIATHKFMK